MKKTKKVSVPKSSGSMITQKTNEDFNKRTPDPSDPNEQKGKPLTAVPNIGDDEIEPTQGHANDTKMPADLIEGGA